MFRAQRTSDFRLPRFARLVESVFESHQPSGFSPSAFKNWIRVLATAVMTQRIDLRFQRLAAERRAALVTYVMGGDPDLGASQAILEALPSAGADVIELGMPFTDPMADGPAVQAAGARALKAGQTLHSTLGMVRTFRRRDSETPVILMGYLNPVCAYGVEAFLEDAKNAGVDGIIVVDCPPEEDDELCLPARKKGLAFIRLAAPTTDDARLPMVLKNASGFIYYVSITGVTGSAAPDPKEVAQAVGRIKARTRLPVAVGFGVKNAESAAAIAKAADGVVVGSSLVEAIRVSLREGAATSATVASAVGLVEELSRGVRGVLK